MGAISMRCAAGRPSRGIQRARHSSNAGCMVGIRVARWRVFHGGWLPNIIWSIPWLAVPVLCA